MDEKEKTKDIADLLESGTTFGMGFNQEGLYGLRGQARYELSSCIRPCHNQPGPCVCYGRSEPMNPHQ